MKHLESAKDKPGVQVSFKFEAMKKGGLVLVFDTGTWFACQPDLLAALMKSFAEWGCDK
ncbi:MAG: hypothetical protein WBG50_19485 [Desulfomonilaceae bacterium]